jgi:kynurenine formamidase
MRHRTMFGIALAAVCAAACAPAAPPVAPQSLAAIMATATVIDLSHDYASSSIYWPTAEGFELEVVEAGVNDQGYYYSANNFRSAEHGGTHLDAPVHFAAGRRTVEQIPLNHLIGAAVVIDVSDVAASDADLQVGVAEFESWEGRHGQIQPGAIVLIRTDFSKRWPDAAAYLGTAERGADAVARLHFPGLHPDAAQWLVEQRSIKAVGLDTASIDYGQSTGFETHRILAARDIPIFENLTQLDQLPARGATLVALPMKIAGGSGAPLRAIALVD